MATLMPAETLTTADPPEDGPRPSLAAALAGPLLIAAVGLWLMRAYVFEGLASGSDVLTFWLPMYTELGRALGDGHIPAWTPHALAGQPFAADPHSGWAQVLPMALFSTLAPATALGLLVGLQPIIAGLGAYAFLRGERASRGAATIAGLVLVVLLSTAKVGVTVRFPGIIAWTAVSLAVASRVVRARSVPTRIGWTVLLALAWGQAVAIHVTVGAALATVMLAGYLIPAAVRARASGTPSRTILATAGLIVAAIVSVNLAVMLPRAALVSGTSIAGGYDEISERSEELTGLRSPPYPGFRASPTWPANLVTVPGIPVGAAALSLSLAGWWSPRRRTMVAAFSALGLVSWALTTRPVADLVHRRLGGVPFVDQYLHQPQWFSVGLVVAVAVLAGLGADAWREAGGRSRRAVIAALGASAWLVLALAYGAALEWILPFAVGAIALAGLSLAGRGTRSVWTAGVAALVCAELLVPTLITAERPWRERLPPIGRTPEILRPMPPATVDVQAFATPRAIARTLLASGGRFLALGRRDGVPTRHGPALQNNEALLFALESAGGYRSLQPDRIWTLLRRMHDEPVRYNRATVSAPTELYLDLLAVEWLIAPRRPPNTRLVAADAGFGLFRRTRVPPRASVIAAWEVVDGPEGSLARVLQPGFEDERLVVLEEDPGLETEPGGEGPAGRAVYRAAGDQAAVVEVVADRPAILLVRNGYDPGWSATVDGQPAPVLAADHAIQAVAVPRGRHVVELSYDDPSVGLGLAGSAAALGGFGVAAGAAALRRRRLDGGASARAETLP